jgi:hypothetical protein
MIPRQNSESNGRSAGFAHLAEARGETITPEHQMCRSQEPKTCASFRAPGNGRVLDPAFNGYVPVE